jgi:hypothetical protein
VATKVANRKKAGKGSPKVYRFGCKQKHGKSRERYFERRRLRLLVKK